MRKYLSLAVLFVLFAFHSLTAQVTVVAKLDSTAIVIGDQTRLTFELTQKPGQAVVWPVLSDSLPGGLQVVEALKADTSKSDEGLIEIRKSYIVTAFEDSLYYLPAFPFVLNGDTVWTKSLALKVIQPFKIDVNSRKLADIKPVMYGPYDWQGLLLILFFVALVHGLLALAIFVYRKYFKTDSVAEQLAPELQLPAYVVALESLDKIKQDKAWQMGRSKEYHTQLTDVLRSYIERMYHINSMEMTSDEILDELRMLHLENKQVYPRLKEILTLADLVKFAKWEPTPDEHEHSLANAYYFINQTKVEDLNDTEASVHTSL